jgi:hypothetical protein
MIVIVLMSCIFYLFRNFSSNEMLKQINIDSLKRWALLDITYQNYSLHSI